MTPPLLKIENGFEVYVLENEFLQATIIPQLGAKIASLKTFSTGREWMWSPLQARLFSNDLGSSFPESTLIGADECFPTLAACMWEGRSLPDHGELWTERWEVEATDNGVITSVRCPLSPFKIQRKAELHKNELRLEYVLENLGDKEETFVWALHPLMNILPGDQIDLPASEVWVDSAINCPLEAHKESYPWPSLLCGMKLDQMDFGPYFPAAAKIYAADLTKGQVGIRNKQSGEALEFLFDLRELDAVGIWINRGGWNGFDHVAIEPTNSIADALDIATDRKHCGKLSPGGVRYWTVTLKISPPTTL